ncbi:MAG: YebC/PmpR family DNA-binding transcriptional regulator [Lachnospiraceae bacterium]|nr:YebC/PmpR family DNA-binding transcriptional regulator [Lachnospiraceae bacterium]
MSGHSKFNNIKHKKEKADAARGKIFTVIGHEIAIAVKQGGPDPTSNSKLRDVIAKARANNMPNDTIEKGIKKAAGNVDAVNFEELVYEGFGPSGVAIMVRALTDNKNRTGGNVRSAFTKGNGNLGSQGSVSYMFKEKGQILVDKEECDKSADELMELALENGASDFNEEDDSYEILTEPSDFSTCREALEKAGIKMLEADVTMIPENYVSVTDEDAVYGLRKTLDLLDEDEDVKAYYTNWEEE